MANVVLIVPTAINVLNAVTEKLNASARAGVEGSVALPSLRRRAWMIVNETGIIPVEEVVIDTSDSTIRGQ